MNKYHWLLGCGVIAFTGSAHAQSASAVSASEQTQLQDIVVTAQKRSENLQNVPIAVSAFSAEALEKQQNRDIGDLTGRVPTLVITQSGAGPSAANVSLRGIFFQDIEKSFEPGVGVVMDGVYLSTSTGQLLQSFDFAQVEVLRGPQGTLFGKNTTGGALNVTRTRPSMDHWTGKARVTVGSFGRNDYEGVISGPLIQDKLAVKAAVFSMNDHGAWRNTTTTGDTGKKDYFAYSLAVRATPSDAVDLQITYDHTNDKSQLAPFQSYLTAATRPTGVPSVLDGGDKPCMNPSLPSLCHPLPQGRNINRANDPSRSRYSLDAMTANFKADLGPFSFVSVTGYRSSKEDLYTDYDAVEQHLFYVHRPAKFEQFSEEARIETEFDGPFNFVTGIYYFNSNYTLNQSTFLDLAALLPLPLGTVQSYSGTRTSQRSDSTAVFFQGDYKMTDALTITLGGRQSWDNKRFRYTAFSQVAGSYDPATFFNPVNDTILFAKFSEFTPRVAARYEFSPAVNVYASFSRGYNSGGFNGRGGGPLLLGPYQPEIVKAYEAGIKTELLDRRLRLNAAVFQNDFSDKQEEVAIALPVAPFTGTSVRNVSAARYRGVEVEATAIPVRGLTISSSLGYLDAKFTDFVASLRPGTPVQDVSSLRLRRAPKWTLSGYIDYETDVGPGKAGFNVGVNFVDKMELNLLNDAFGRRPATTKIDAAVRYDWVMNGLQMRATVFGKNLTNKTPINAFVNAGLGSFVEIGTQDIRRSWGAELQVKF